jgi:hypothetical protein
LSFFHLCSPSPEGEFVIARMFNNLFKDKENKENNVVDPATTTTPSSPSAQTFPSGVSQHVAQSEAGSLESDARRPRPTTHNSTFDDGFRYQTVCGRLPCR